MDGNSHAENESKNIYYYDSNNLHGRIGFSLDGGPI